MSGIVGSLNTRGSGLINIGSAADGQLFTGTGAGLPVGFEAAAGGGKVLQAITGEVPAATASTTSNAWADIAGMTVAITPSASSSKIFCIAQIRAEGGVHWATRLVRNDGSSDTGVGVGTIVSARYGASAGGLYRVGDTNTQMGHHIMVLDSPSTTDERTYKAQWAIAGGTEYLNRNSANSDTGGGASTSARDAHSYSCITVFEIGA
jgi:hypothetical protein